jgi:hypothetical protein
MLALLQSYSLLACSPASTDADVGEHGAACDVSVDSAETSGYRVHTPGPALQPDSVQLQPQAAHTTD